MKPLTYTGPMPPNEQREYELQQLADACWETRLRQARDFDLMAQAVEDNLDDPKAGFAQYVASTVGVERAK